MNPPLTRRPSPRLSVLMPVHNAERYLPQAIDSILAQTFTDFQLLAIDDGSTDNSLAILRDYEQRDPRLRVLAFPNAGISTALNRGLAFADAPFIARMDADDTCHPDRFRRQFDFLQNHPDCVAVGTAVQCTDPTGSPTATQDPPLDHPHIDAALLAGRADVLVHATLLARTDALRKIAGYRPQFDWVEDLDLLLRLAEVGKLANLPDHLYHYRRHASSVCSSHYDEMCRRISLVLADAYHRRGLGKPPALSDLRPELAEKQRIPDFYRNWACHAIHRNNIPLARKHALTALKLAPFSPNSWKVVYWALSA